MSKPVKGLIRKELVKKFDGLTSLAVVGFTGIDAVTTCRIRGRLGQKDIRLAVVKNSIARQAFKEVGLAEAGKLLDGPCAIAFATDCDDVEVVKVIRELLAIGKESPTLTVKAAVLEGEVFGPDRIDQLSKYPTRQEALAILASCVLSPGAKLAGCVVSPAAKVAGLIKAIKEKKQQEDQPGDKTAA